MSGFPYFQDVNGRFCPKLMQTICNHPTCTEVAITNCLSTIDSCKYRFCALHSVHYHHKCCVVDHTTSCKSLATHRDETETYACDHHFATFVNARCQRCNVLQGPARREYKYCISCRDDMERERHGYWYALRQKGVSGPYGSAMLPQKPPDCVIS